MGLARDKGRALASHRQGNFAKTERLYLTVLRANPGDFNALHLLGGIRLEQRRPEDAREQIHRALEVSHALGRG
jgi:hypothetical protein